MKYSPRISLALALAFLAISAGAVKAQEACQPPAVVTSPAGSNIFSERQETELGDILAEQLPRYVRVTEDVAVTDFMAHVGERLARDLPPTNFKFRYFLVDLAGTDAFSIAGGRIYVTRGMVASVHNEDEMASIIGHEMGHILTHQSAIDITTLLREVLSVTAVSDRLDILKKYDALEENWRRNPGAFRRIAREGLEQQLAADQVGLYAIAAAGYSTQSYADIFDRTARTEGKTGDWLSDFFRTTKPNELRLREIVNSVENMPRACADHKSLQRSHDFAKWRESLYAFAGWTQRSEDLHGVLAKVKLEPAGRPPHLEALKFSPNGKYVLAQRGDILYILTRQPFVYSFQIHAADAQQIQFTPDAENVVFTNGNTRVEVWDVASQKRLRVDDPLIETGCRNTALAPNARALACLRPNGVLSLIDLANGAEIFSKEDFAVGRVRSTLEFSPDGNYFLAATYNRTLGFDLLKGGEIALPGSLKERLGDGFVFLDPHRLMVRSRSTAAPSIAPILFANGNPGSVYMTDSYNHEERPAALFAFPTGRALGKLPLSRGIPSAPARGDYVIVRPFGRYPVGALDLNTRKIALANKNRALDIWGEFSLDERSDGEVGLYKTETLQLLAQARLPAAPDPKTFGKVYVSPGLKWIASSEGPVWDVTTGKKISSFRRFSGGWFDGDKFFYADFPKDGDTPRTLARVDLTRQDISRMRDFDASWGRQEGPVVVSREPQQKNRLAAAINPCNWSFPDYDPQDCDVVYKVSDLLTGNLLWSRQFPKLPPRMHFEPDQERAVMSWPAATGAALDEIRRFPKLAEQLAAVKDRKGLEFVEVVEASTGKVLAAQVVDTGGQNVAAVLGDWIVASHRGYMQVYSLSTGLKAGDIPGWPRTYSKAAPLMSVRPGNENELAVYDLNRLEKLDEFSFSSNVEFDHFSEDGKRLFVLTADQTAYILDVSKSVRRQSVAP